MNNTPTEKKCPKCGEIKRLDLFYNNKNKPLGKSWACKACDNKRTLAQGRTEKGKAKALERNRRYTKRNPEAVKASQKKHKEKKRQVMNEARSSGCVVCGYNKCNEALDFHHVDSSTKEKSISDLLCSGSMDDLKKEISKCVVLCANCHREHHAGQLNLGISLASLT